MTPPGSTSARQERLSETNSAKYTSTLSGRELTESSYIKTAAQTDSAAPEKEKTKEYVIKSGDTFWAIAKNSGLKVDQLQSLNPSVDPLRLKIGQIIILPSNVSANSQITAPKPSNLLPRTVEGALGNEIAERDQSLRESGTLKEVEKTSWLIVDIKSGERIVAIDSHNPHPVASMIKPFVALAFFHEIWKKRQTWNSENEGLVQAMLQRSDNAATNSLIEKLGGPTRVQAIIKANYGEICQNVNIIQKIPDDGREYKNTATAEDCARLLLAMYNQKLPGSSNLMEIMGGKMEDRIVDGTNGRIPAETPVMRKGGATAMFIGDMGIVQYTAPNGETKPVIFIGMISRSERAMDYYEGFGNRSDGIIRDTSIRAYEYLKEKNLVK